MKKCFIIKNASCINSFEFSTSQSLFVQLSNISGEFEIFITDQDKLLPFVLSYEFQLLTKKYHIIHSGLNYIDDKYLAYLNLISLNWNFLTPNSNIASFSWKATSHFIYCNSDTWKRNSPLQKFKSIDVLISEFSFRAQRNGYLTYYNPLSETNISLDFKSKIKSSNFDQLFFIKFHYGPKILFYLLIVFVFSLKVHAVLIAIKLLLLSRKEMTYESSIEVNNYPISPSVHSSGNFKFCYTAIIPTILRYDFLSKSIDSLIKSPIPPNEIIVVDQTPKNKRIKNYYSQYQKLTNFKVFYLDEAGQSSSRNLAIDKAENEWILLFEDDGEAWDNMVENHMKLISISSADVSTGISLAPWKDVSYIPKDKRGYKISDVFSTGNAFLKKNTAQEVNGLHMAYNKGSGADDDLGKRLFLSGKLILNNPTAIMTHHKAPTGGMRVHGAWWRNKTTTWGEFPPTTQTYTILKFYPRKMLIPHIFRIFLTAKKRYNNYEFLFLIILFPFKAYKSLSRAKKLLKKYP